MSDLPKKPLLELGETKRGTTVTRLGNVVAAPEGAEPPKVQGREPAYYEAAKFAVTQMPGKWLIVRDITDQRITTVAQSLKKSVERLAEQGVLDPDGKPVTPKRMEATGNALLTKKVDGENRDAEVWYRYLPPRQKRD